MKQTIVFFAFMLILFTGTVARAQSLQDENIVIVKDENITGLEEYYVRLNARNPETEGYRVQIFLESGTYSKSKATGVKQSFEAKYPGVKAYLMFKEPNYIVRVGNFRTADEAYGFKKEISVDYPNAYPVVDRVHFKDL